MYVCMHTCRVCERAYLWCGKHKDIPVKLSNNALIRVMKEHCSFFTLKARTNIQEPRFHMPLLSATKGPHLHPSLLSPCHCKVRPLQITSLRKLSPLVISFVKYCVYPVINRSHFTGLFYMRLYKSMIRRTTTHF